MHTRGWHDRLALLGCLLLFGVLPMRAWGQLGCQDVGYRTTWFSGHSFAHEAELSERRFCFSCRERFIGQPTPIVKSQFFLRESQSDIGVHDAAKVSKIRPHKYIRTDNPPMNSPTTIWLGLWATNGFSSSHLRAFQCLSIKRRSVSSIPEPYMYSRMSPYYINASFFGEQPRTLSNLKVMPQIHPLVVRNSCIDSGSYERHECYNTKHPLGSKLLALVCVVFLLCCCISFFKVFDCIPKWNEWIVFGIATISGLGITASGVFVFLILGGLC